MRLNVVSGVLSFQFKAAFFTAITVDSSSSSFTDLDQFKAKLKNNNGPKSARLLNDSEASKGVTNCQRRRFSFKVCQSVFFYSLFPFLFLAFWFLFSVFCFIRVRLETFFSCHCLFRVSSTTLASSSSSTLDICTTRSKKSANTSLTIELDLHIKLNIE